MYSQSSSKSPNGRRPSTANSSQGIMGYNTLPSSPSSSPSLSSSPSPSSSSDSLFVPPTPQYTDNVLPQLPVAIPAGAYGTFVQRSYSSTSDQSEISTQAFLDLDMERWRRADEDELMQFPAIESSKWAERMRCFIGFLFVLVLIGSIAFVVCMVRE